jgi:hypothetical protein
MNIEAKVDSLYPIITPIRLDEIEDGSVITEAQKAFLKREWPFIKNQDTPFKELPIEELLLGLCLLIKDNTMPLRDLWREVIKEEIRDRLMLDYKPIK